MLLCAPACFLLMQPGGQACSASCLRSNLPASDMPVQTQREASRKRANRAREKFQLGSSHAALEIIGTELHTH